MTLTTKQFLVLLMRHYESNGRTMPWRIPEADGSFDDYKILVSELMLQQTQVDRVIPRFGAFITRFPSIGVLAESMLADVLELWIGLGYNRRAQYLHQAARELRMVSSPWPFESLVSCKGIGANTASAIRTYAYSTKEYFIETNIRTVLLHHFYPNGTSVSDNELADKMQRIVDSYQGSFRELYWAFMDYGTYLKKQGVTSHRHSKHYTKQSKYTGSSRQIRGAILRGAQRRVAIHGLRSDIHDDRFDHILAQMIKEQLVVVRGDSIVLFDMRQ